MDYAQLQAEVIEWMERAGQVAKAPLWIRLAEARFNRELGVVETSAILMGALGIRTIDISAISMERPIALFLSDPGSNEDTLTPKAEGTFEYRSSTGRPKFWAIDGEAIAFDCPLAKPYQFRFRFRQRFALSDTVATNWLLENHPDLYLAGTLVWGAGYNQDWPNGSVWKQVLEEAIPQVKSQIAQSKRGTATVDPALSMVSRGSRYAVQSIG
ncbi:hypothetical protein ACFOOL_14945 [Devosia honganensis]|uniref:Uncharacterized protein n=1 Tax=Devosia honganensis TaxID=1610527 RepID=A0ABV7X608_9HYPH